MKIKLEENQIWMNEEKPYLSIIIKDIGSLFDDCEIGIVVYPDSVQPFNTFLRYDNSKTGEHKTVKFNVNYCPICGRKIKKEEEK